MTHRRWEELYWHGQGTNRAVTRCTGSVVNTLEPDEQLGQVEHVRCERCGWELRVWRSTEEQHKRLTTR